MREVTLHGFLGEKFTKSIMLEVDTCAEAIAALRANYPDFERELVAYAPGYRVYIDERNIAEEEVTMVSKGAIRIVPHIAGSGDGLFQVILGAALIGASLIPGLNAALWSGASSMLLGMGVSMVLGGITGMLFKPPTAEAPEEKDKPSYAFNGPVNTSLEGNPVSVLFGRLIVGSQVVSADIRTSEIKPE